MGCVIIRPPSGPLARAYNQGRGKPVEPSSSSLYLHHHHSLHAIAAPVAGKAHLTNNISTLIQNNPPVKRGDKTFALNRSALSSQTAMGAFYDEIPDDDLVKWILDQKIFWVATAPLAKDGHVNVSPKGRPTFNLVGKNACWYTDMSGSGNETISHLYENQRITVAFVAFEGPPRIVRFFGTGRVLERGTPEFYSLLPEGDERILPGTRAIIWVDIHQVGTSCGYSVPFFDYQGERLILDNFFEKWQEGSDVRPDGVPSKLISYWNKKNGLSIDSMPGLKLADDLSTALVPPFKLKSIAQSEKQIDGASEPSTTSVGVRKQSYNITLPVLAGLIASSFILGIIATYGFMAGYQIAAL